MQTLAILEESGEVTRLLQDMPELCRCTLIRPQPQETVNCALLVVAPDFRGAAPQGVCRILLTPSEKSSLLSAVTAEWVISFGPSARESISFSSLHTQGLTLCIRRALPTLSGRVLERQEIPLRCRNAAPESMLTACAAALLARQ